MTNETDALVSLAGSLDIIETRTETDDDGTYEVREQANGVIVRMLTEPSAAYLKQQEDERAAVPPPAPTFEQMVAQAVSFADLKALVMEQSNHAAGTQAK